MPLLLELHPSRTVCGSSPACSSAQSCLRVARRAGTRPGGRSSGTGSSPGSTLRCRSRTYRHRGLERAAARQRDQAGRAARDRHQRLVARPSSRGIDCSRPHVYGCSGAPKIFSVGGALDHLPGVHDRDLVACLGDHAEVVGDQDHRHAEFALQARDQIEDLRLHRHVERGRRLVGDQHLGLVRRAPSRSSRAGASRPRARAGSRRCAGAGRGSRPAQQLDRALASRCLEISLWARIASISWFADLVERVQRGQRVLEDHRDVVAADLAQLFVGR